MSNEMVPVTRARTAWLACATLATALGGCGVLEDNEIDEAPAVESSQSGLFFDTTATLWGETIPVCFVTNHFTAAQQDTIRKRVTDSWGRAARINFTGWGNCASPIPGGTVAVQVGNLGGSLGLAEPFGFPGASAHSTVTYSSANPSQKTTIHEFGHILGFFHEHLDNNTCNQRTPATGNDELGTQADQPNSVMSQTKCNSASNLSPWDIVGVQNAYGRRLGGSIVGMNAECLDLPSPFTAPQQLRVFGCNSANNQLWRAASDATISSPVFVPNFVEVLDGGTANGTPIRTNGQGGGFNQSWRFPSVEIRGIGNLCLDIPSGSIFDGQKVQTYPCHNGSNQKWKVEHVAGANLFIHAAANVNFCIKAASNLPGAPLRLTPCNIVRAEQIFQFTALGEIKSSGLCWDSKDNLVAPRDMQLAACKADGRTKRNQQYFLRGNIVSDVVSSCLSTSTADFRPGDPAQLWGCSQGPDFIWDYYFNP